MDVGVLGILGFIPSPFLVNQKHNKPIIKGIVFSILCVAHRDSEISTIPLKYGFYSTNASKMQKKSLNGRCIG